MTAPLVPLDPVQAEHRRLTTATANAFAAESASRKRDPFQVGLSAIGGCRRAAAYALSRTAVSDHPGPEEGRAANLGTYQHNGLLPRLRDQLPGSQIEVPVLLRVAGISIPGHIDLDDPVTVVDLKTVGEWRLSGVRRTGAAYYHHLVQVGGYALARLQAGRTPEYVAWLYLDRANGDEEILVEPFTNALALMVVDRVTELVRLAQDPDRAPRDEYGPGLSIICDKCPWLRQCWGEDATPGRRGAQRVYDDAEIAAALLAYDDARAQEKAAKQEKDFQAAKVDGTPRGTYGRATYGRDRDTVQDDPWASVRKLKALGLEVPQFTKRGSMRVKIIAPPPKGETP